MEIKVRIFAGDKQLNPEDVSKLVIHNATVDRIVNDIADRAMEEGRYAAPEGMQ